MWIKSDRGLQWYNLAVMAEVAFRQDAYGTWELVVREPGCPVAKTLLSNIATEDVDYVREQLTKYTMGIEAESLRPKKQRAEKEA